MDNNNNNKENKLSEVIYILGAQDPEMRAIEEVLKKYEIQFCHVAVANQRCNASNAYFADSVVSVGKDGVPRPFLLRPTQAVFAVECNLNGFTPAFRLDHHNPGDAGFEMPPERYMEGSSLGQVLRYFGEVPTDTHRLLCAADHCLTAAYQGQCPDVDPGELLFMRAAWKAKMTDRSLSETMDDIIDAANWVRKHQGVDGTSVCLDPTQTPREVAEGSAYAGIPIQYMSMSEDGRLKRMFKGGSKEQVETFMADHQAQGHRVYGNPYRGYAGAYLRGNRPRMIG